MIVCKTKAEVKAVLRGWRKDGVTHAAVPTMGALHEGHLSLIDTGLAHSDMVFASIFVNPIQFGPKEDFASYPRDLERDIALLAGRGCHAVFAPSAEEMFAEDFSTRVSVSGITEGYCGAARPHFFEGVATIVTKLLNILEPHTAVFGEKDYQQLATIRRMVRDLDMPVTIVGGATLREASGLAMSSRNAYLGADERGKAAPALYRALTETAARLTGEGAAMAQLRPAALTTLTQAGFGPIDYFDLADAASLAPIERADRPARLLAAAWLGKTRLIDNIAVESIN